MPKVNKNSSKELIKINPNKRFGRVMGMRDIYSPEYKYWSAIINKIQETANLYGFERLESPIIENVNMHKKSPHLDEMYIFSAGKTDKVALRAELSTGAVRFFAEQELPFSPRPTKMFSMGPVFRQVKVRSGHYRQFNQFSLEIFGDDKPVAEAFLIFLAYNFFKDLQLDVQIQLNSVGSFECQKEYYTKLSKYLKEKARKIKPCPECKVNINKNPWKVLECQEESCQELKNEAPQIANLLSDDSNKHFTTVLEYLDELGVNYNFDPYLLRAPNYYSDTIFEVLPLNADGTLDDKLSLGSGGRYGHLVNQLGGPDCSLVGFAGGIECTVMKMKEKNLMFKKDEDLIFLAQLSDSARIKGLTLFEELHNSGFNVRQSFTVDSLREQLEEAKSLDANIVLILGKKELANGTILVRDVEQGSQELVTMKDLQSYLKKLFNPKKA